MLMLFASAFVLGLVFNAAPGAVFAETVRQGVRGGYRPALAVQLGSLVGDASWALLGLAGIGLVKQVDTLRWPPNDSRRPAASESIRSTEELKREVMGWTPSNRS